MGNTRALPIISPEKWRLRRPALSEGGAQLAHMARVETLKTATQAPCTSLTANTSQGLSTAAPWRSDVIRVIRPREVKVVDFRSNPFTKMLPGSMARL